MAAILNNLRRYLIRKLAGRMEVCLNMTIINGEVAYNGHHGGAICEANKFVQLCRATEEAAVA